MMINKKTAKLLLPCLIALAALFPAKAQVQPAIRISTLDDLRKVGKSADYPLNADYELVSDIDASLTRTKPFEPIGGNVYPFTGRFYGENGAVFVIRNLYINRPDSGYAGLFGAIGYDGEVANVGVVAYVAGHYAVGTLAGASNGNVVNCYGAGTVAAKRGESNAGGLVGVNGGSISKSYSSASVDGRENVGGLAGLLMIAPAGEISDCFAVGNVSGSNAVGGLVGLAFGGRIESCFSGGMAAGKSGKGFVGGLVGKDFAVSPPWSDRGVFEIDGVAYYVEAVAARASFWDMGASRASVSAAGEGKSSAEMMSRGTFLGWDFDRTWSLVEGVHYPQLAAIPMYTHTLAYSVDNEECGRLNVSSG
ncbi:MAG: hypothetical protein LBH93_03940, partial [Chitinispirillales bacterium]|nr:hypothetical protein [Chitinispirillales bacterium]